jgi:hypothetical protein
VKSPDWLYLSEFLARFSFKATGSSSNQSGAVIKTESEKFKIEGGRDRWRERWRKQTGRKRDRAKE